MFFPSSLTVLRGIRTDWGWIGLLQGGPYGENIAAGQRTPEDVCKNWGIDEREKYDFLAGDYGTETGHFTQMVSSLYLAGL